MRIGVIGMIAMELGLATVGVPAACAEPRQITLDLPKLSDAAVGERLDFLERRLDSERFDAQLWQYGWSAFNGGTMIVDAVQAATEDDRKDRNTHIVRAVEGLYGIVDLWLYPLPARFGADPVRAMRGVNAADRRARLARAADLVSRGAARADEPYRVLPHLTILGINLAAGVVIWQLADASHAYRTVLPGLLIGEVQLWTQPRGPSDDLADYRGRFGDGRQAADWWLTPRRGGIEVTFRF